MKRILIASPARIGRFAHQTQNILTAIYIAHLTKSKLMLPRYMLFCDKWNAVIDWSKHKDVISQTTDNQNYKIIYLEKEVDSDKLSQWQGFTTGKKSWNLEDPSELGDLISSIENIREHSLIFLPFDQSSTYLMRLLNKKEFKDEFSKVFSLQGKRKLPKKPYVCLHIRRGDVTKEDFPHWFVPDIFYISLIKSIVNTIPNDIEIAICTQGSIKWLVENNQNSLSKQELSRLKIYSTPNLHINENEIEDFSLMVNSHVLFSANSGFSNFAGVLKASNHQIDVSRSNCKHYLNKVIRINPDTEISLSMNKVAETMRSIEWNS